VDGPWHAATDASWRVVRHRMAFHPITGEPWTAAQINACEWGGYALP
jgi:hypothetical protein